MARRIAANGALLGLRGPIHGTRPPGPPAGRPQKAPVHHPWRNQKAPIPLQLGRAFPRTGGLWATN
eukprot:5341968-Pyramimonas_sp.AAC.1